MEVVEKIMGGKVLYSEIDKVFDEGVKEGLEQGLEQGIEQGEISSIKNLMKNMDIPADKAMEFLGISDESKKKYMDMLNS